MCFGGIRRSVTGAAAKRRVFIRRRPQGGATYFTIIQYMNCDILTCAMSAWQSKFLKIGLNCGM